MTSRSRHPGFGRFVRQQTAAASLAGLSIGLVLAVLLLFVGTASGNLSFQVELSRGDVLWFLILPPVLLLTMCIVVSPLSFVLLLLTHRLRPGRDQQ